VLVRAKIKMLEIFIGLSEHVDRMGHMIKGDCKHIQLLKNYQQFKLL